MYVDYDTYASMSPLRKNHVLHQLAPENVAELVATHWRRFLEANRTRLNSDQIQFMEEGIAGIRPEDYRLPRDERAVRARGEAMEKRLNELFALEDRRKLSMEAFKNSGEIPNPIARALVRTRPRFDDSSADLLLATLNALGTLAPEDLRNRRDIAGILERAFETMPSGDEFWIALGDDDVRLAASRAYWIIRSQRIRNPIALSFRRQKWPIEPHQLENVQAALADLASRPMNDLRAARYGDDDLASTLAQAFEGMPSGDEFWRAVDDEDVRLLANRMRVLIEMQQSGALPPPDQRR